MEFMESMESIWNSWNPWNPCGFHGTNIFHMDSIWIPYGFHMECGGTVKYCYRYRVRNNIVKNKFNNSQLKIFCSRILQKH
jgi:hypothetical protein